MSFSRVQSQFLFILYIKLAARMSNLDKKKKRKHIKESVDHQHQLRPEMQADRASQRALICFSSLKLKSLVFA